MFNITKNKFLEDVLSFGKDLKRLILSRGYDYKKYEDQIKVNRLFIDVTNICNARCIFCAYKNARHKKGVMDFPIFRKAVDEFDAMGGGMISLTPIVGEPLIDPTLLEKIEYARNLKNIQRISFTTNGILLGDNELYKKVIDSGVDAINVTISGTNEDEYEQIFGVRSYQKAINGISLLMRYNKETGDKKEIVVNFRTKSGNLNDTYRSSDFNEYIRPYLSQNCRVTNFNSYDNWGGIIGENDLVGNMKMKRIPRIKNVPCVRTFDFKILWDGSVRVCNCRMRESEFDGLVVGNICNSTLKELVHSKEVRAIRESFPKNKVLDECKDCSLYCAVNAKELMKRVK